MKPNKKARNCGLCFDSRFYFFFVDCFLVVFFLADFLGCTALDLCALVFLAVGAGAGDATAAGSATGAAACAIARDVNAATTVATMSFFIWVPGDRSVLN